MKVALNFGLSGMSQMGQGHHCVPSCLGPAGFVLSVPKRVDKVLAVMLTPPL